MQIETYGQPLERAKNPTCLSAEQNDQRMSFILVS